MVKGQTHNFVLMLPRSRICWLKQRRTLQLNYQTHSMALLEAHHQPQLASWTMMLVNHLALYVLVLQTPISFASYSLASAIEK